MQRSASGHGVPALAGEWATPLPASHESTVHAFPSSTLGGAPAAHAPAPSQVSSPLQRSASGHGVPALAGAWATPLAGSHESTVQGLPSSTTGGVPAAHRPTPSQVSSPLHTSASAHGWPAGSGEWETPCVGWHESAVHELPSSTTGGVPGTQVPAPSQVSSPLHTSASAQPVPAGSGEWETPCVGWHESAVHGLPSSTTGGVPPAQVPAPSHASSPLQTSASGHGWPAGRGGWVVTPVEGSHTSAVHGLPSDTGTHVPVTSLVTCTESPTWTSRATNVPVAVVPCLSSRVPYGANTRATIIASSPVVAEFGVAARLPLEPLTPSTKSWTSGAAIPEPSAGPTYDDWPGNSLSLMRTSQAVAHSTRLRSPTSRVCTA